MGVLNSFITDPARYQGSHSQIIFGVNHISSTAIFSACEGRSLKAGSRVFFYDSTGQLVRGVVESTSRMADGTQMVIIRRDNGGIMTLPSASVSKG
ncbi:uncharacterized protein ARMOST_15431 [Armillaria ostoyae]|uniref:Uncharacterized protein n=1 Tax=Armillaria ostoyae TaxID=47428 RepID=A0A284RTD7_ARMOS|nr:uncharacterized protein ARMOST_15431 [Armillaria ostoyae]